MMSDMLEMQVQFPVIKREEIRKIRTVGRGTFGVVYHGFSLAVGHVAIKVCHSDSDQRKLAKEVENTIRVSASHPNIVKLFGTFDCPQNGLSIVYEYMSGGSLHDVILKRTDLVYCVDHVVSWIYQISSAMAHMHKCKIVHRDVKPENILMNELFTTVKLCDLGEARVLHDDHSNPTPRVGTYLFMAPEVMLEGKYTFGVDVYSLGITIWMMFARRVPSFVMQFTGNVVDFVNAVRNGRRPSKLPMLEIFNQMVADCLKGDPEERAKITEVRDFAAELVEKFPFGNNFLVRLPDSKVLQEPLNVRGDVRSGEGVATRPSPMETLKPAPRTKKPTTPGSKARLETPREIKDKVDNDERKQQEERDHQRAMIEHINALKAARERARIEEEERQRDMQRQREMERVEQQKVVQSVTFDLNVQAHSPEVEQPTTLDTVDTVDRDLEQITVEDNGHADEGLSLVEPVVNIADVLPQAQETQEEKLKHFYLNSTRIPINVVKDRMKKFEKE